MVEASAIQDAPGAHALLHPHAVSRVMSQGRDAPEWQGASGGPSAWPSLLDHLLWGRLASACEDPQEVPWGGVRGEEPWLWPTSRLLRPHTESREAPRPQANGAC